MRISDWSSDVCSSDLGAVCDDLDSIQRRERNRRNIDALYGTVIRNAVPVDERKRRVGPQSTQVKRGGRAAILIPTLCATSGNAGVLTAPQLLRYDRKHVVSGKSGAVRVDHGGGRIIKKK